MESLSDNSLSAASASSSVAIQPSGSGSDITIPIRRAVTSQYQQQMTCQPLPRWNFTQGILLGQASIIILAILFLKYVVFEDPVQSRRNQLEREREQRDKILQKHERKMRRSAATSKRHKSRPSLPPPHVPISSILQTLAYDLPSHPPESLDWLNVLIAQTLNAYRDLVGTSKAGAVSGGENGETLGGAKGLMEEVLNRKSKAEDIELNESSLAGGKGGGSLVGLDWINVEEVELGDRFPVLSNARVRPSGGEHGGVRVELDVDYSDHVSLSISTNLLVNFPRPRFAVLPVSLGLTLERFSGTLTLELPSIVPLVGLTNSSPASPPFYNTSSNGLKHPTNHGSGGPTSSSSSSHPSIHLSLHPDFTLQIRTTSLLGSRAKLQDVPKVEQLILARIRGWIQDRVVWPQGRVQISMPSVPQSPPSHVPPSSPPLPHHLSSPSIVYSDGDETSYGNGDYHDESIIVKSSGGRSQGQPRSPIPGEFLSNSSSMMFADKDPSHFTVIDGSSRHPSGIDGSGGILGSGVKHGRNSKGLNSYLYDDIHDDDDDDDDDEGNESGQATPSINLDAEGGPEIHLHPQLRQRGRRRSTLTSIGGAGVLAQ